MAWKTAYPCPECDGMGEYECEFCGSACDCTECDRTGLDPERIDLPAYQRAYEEWRERAPGHVIGCGWFVEGVQLGWQRSDGSDRLAFADFLRPGEP